MKRVLQKVLSVLALFVSFAAAYAGPEVNNASYGAIRGRVVDDGKQVLLRHGNVISLMSCGRLYSAYSKF